jgi:hypothetical protein
MTKFMILFVAMVGVAPAFADFSTGATRAWRHAPRMTVSGARWTTASAPRGLALARGARVQDRHPPMPRTGERQCRRYAVQAAVTSPRENDER